MAYQASPDHYRTSSLSHPANSPFGRTQQQQQQQQSPTAAAAGGTVQLGASTTLNATSPNNGLPLAPFTVRPEIDPLERERREIERRRQRMEDRKHRILHAKTRVLGIDAATLAEQKAERAARDAAEAARERFHDEQTLQNARTLTALEEERKLNERIRHEELRVYREQQAAEKRQRDLRQASGWDHMVDTNTNFLTFTGEDREKSLREKAQKDQQADWLAQQLSDQAQREAQERQDEEDYARMQEQIRELQRLNELDKERNEKMRLRAQQEYNAQQVAQKSSLKLRYAQQVHNDEMKELNTTLASDLLNERVAPSALAAHRRIPYHFKGMTPSERQRILDEQYEQIQQLQLKRARERQEAADEAKQNEIVRKEMIRQDRAREEAERQRALALRDERAYQAKQKTLRDQYEKHVLYTNSVTPEYFQQFGTSAR